MKKTIYPFLFMLIAMFFVSNDAKSQALDGPIAASVYCNLQDETYSYNIDIKQDVTDFHCPWFYGVQINRSNIKFSFTKNCFLYYFLYPAAIDKGYFDLSIGVKPSSNSWHTLYQSTAIRIYFNNSEVRRLYNSGKRGSDYNCF